ncbi:hypothetical protein [Algicella marina]|uniref:Uncharacterized protein n=1 Tax=Algicella marina TaxID=2683284 RepID=A0A6P1SWJ6_9RHOB|nr:hypothetical protein [Algicella marina]QHQ34818.1 hypothetical protein GO499_06200 [Algicella marina]
MTRLAPQRSAWTGRREALWLGVVLYVLGFVLIGYMNPVLLSSMLVQIGLMLPGVVLFLLLPWLVRRRFGPADGEGGDER